MRRSPFFFYGSLIFIFFSVSQRATVIYISFVSNGIKSKISTNRSLMSNFIVIFGELSRQILLDCKSAFTECCLYRKIYILTLISVIFPVFCLIISDGFSNSYLVGNSSVRVEMDLLKYYECCVSLPVLVWLQNLLECFFIVMRSNSLLLKRK
jgi:hypothetical protein